VSKSKATLNTDFFVSLPNIERIYKEIGMIGKRLQEKKKNMIKNATRQNKNA